MSNRVKMTIQSRGHLSHAQVLHHYHYNPLTGDFKRVVEYDSWCKPIQCDKPIFSFNNRGYYWDRLFNLNFLVHRLIWLYMTGLHPEHEIDHINGNRKDNRWCNLRSVTAFDNARNQGERKDNTSGCRGVNYKSSGRGKKRWVARISHRGVRYLLGNFATFDEAVAVRKQAEIDFEYHQNHAKRGSWVK